MLRPAAGWKRKWLLRTHSMPSRLSWARSHDGHETSTLETSRGSGSGRGLVVAHRPSPIAHRTGQDACWPRKGGTEFAPKPRCKVIGRTGPARRTKPTRLFRRRQNSITPRAMLMMSVDEERPHPSWSEVSDGDDLLRSVLAPRGRQRQSRPGRNLIQASVHCFTGGGGNFMALSG